MKDNKAKQKTGRLRICNKSFSRERGYVEFPDIRLCGKWLWESGFRAGQYILIDHNTERIIITKHRESEENAQGFKIT